MLIIALVLAAIGLAALVFAVVTSNALVAWVCIGASLLGVLLLIADALRERRANQPAVLSETSDDSGGAEALEDPDVVVLADPDAAVPAGFDVTYDSVDAGADDVADVPVELDDHADAADDADRQDQADETVQGSANHPAD